jgi:hypothetical protein
MLSAIPSISPSINNPYTAPLQERGERTSETKSPPTETENIKKENQTENTSKQDLSAEELAQIQKLKTLRRGLLMRSGQIQQQSLLVRLETLKQH